MDVDCSSRAPIRPLLRPLPPRSGGWPPAVQGDLARASLHLLSLLGAPSAPHTLASFSFGLSLVAVCPELSIPCYTTCALPLPTGSDWSCGATSNPRLSPHPVESSPSLLPDVGSPPIQSFAVLTSRCSVPLSPLRAPRPSMLHPKLTQSPS